LKRTLLFIFLISSFCHAALGQTVKEPFAKIAQKEDSLIGPAYKIVRGINAADRFKADSLFTKIFVRALAVNNSFYYPFDSLQTISKLYAPDSSFRIFTWQMVINDNVIRQHGAIQMRTADGSLKLFPLIDKSEVCSSPADTIADNKGWIGAVYYKIILKKSFDIEFYTLIGFDENNIRSTKKVIDILTFTEGKPRFGGRNFIIDNTKGYNSRIARYIMEFSKDASPRLTYDPEMDMIVMEHLVSNAGDPAKKWTLIPDGDYEGFKWMNGKWVYINKIFHQVTAPTQLPVPQPINKDLEKFPGETKP
jgi:hypothetical protein